MGGAANHGEGPSAAWAESAPMEDDSYTCDKLMATARARLALKGYALHIVDRGIDRPAGFMIARWDRSIVLPDLAAVERFMWAAGA